MPEHNNYQSQSKAKKDLSMSEKGLNFNMNHKVYVKYKRGKHTYVDEIDLQKIIDHPEFVDYFTDREKFPSIKFQKWEKKYGKDLVRFFEYAYKFLNI